METLDIGKGFSAMGEIVYALVRSLELTSLTLLIVSAVHKFLRLSSGTLSVWRPSGIAQPIATTGALSLSIVELGVGVAIGTGDLHLRTIDRLLLALLFLMVTSYGLISIWKTGGCGCNGSAAEYHSRGKAVQAWIALGRNIAIFGLAYCATSTGVYGLRTGGALAIARSAQIASATFLVGCVGYSIIRWHKTKLLTVSTRVLTLDPGVRDG